MSKMKSILGMYTLVAMAMSGDLNGNSRERYIEPKETDEEKKRRLAKAEIERNIAKGLKEFFYGENSVWAINQKNADKKARRKHWL
jgi:predicted RNA-binding protein with PUA-like domain